MEDQDIMKMHYVRVAALFPAGAEVVIERRCRYGQLGPGHAPSHDEIDWLFVHVRGQTFTARNPSHEELMKLVEIVRCLKAAEVASTKKSAESHLCRGGYPETQPEPMA